MASNRKGNIRYETGDKELTPRSPLYTQPLVVKDTTVVKAGLFVNQVLTGRPWIQHFRKE
jgi:hypothetical protein